MRRKWIVIITTVLLGLVPIGVSALTDDSGENFGYRTNRQAFAWSSQEQSTSATAFTPLPGLEPLTIKRKGPLSVEFSGTFSGAPVDVRLRGRFRPSRASFIPAPGPGGAGTASPDSFSFRFVRGGSAGATCTTLEVEWRSPTGQPITFHAGDIVVDYRFPPHAEARRLGCV